MSYIMSEETYKIFCNKNLKNMPVYEQAIDLLKHLGEKTSNHPYKTPIMIEGEEVYVDPNLPDGQILQTSKSKSTAQGVVFGELPIVMTTDPIILKEVE